MAESTEVVRLVVWALFAFLGGLFLTAGLLDGLVWWRTERRRQRPPSLPDVAQRMLRLGDPAPPDPFQTVDDAIGQIRRHMLPQLQDLTTHQLLHTLWTKAVGTPNYNKDEWIELERRFRRNR